MYAVAGYGVFSWVKGGVINKISFNGIAFCKGRIKTIAF
jgi:hypothetical protein